MDKIRIVKLMREEPPCPHCVKIDNAMKEESYAEFFGQFAIIPADVSNEEGRDMARAYGIRTVPAFVYIDPNADGTDLVYAGSDVRAVKDWFEMVQTNV